MSFTLMVLSEVALEKVLAPDMSTVGTSFLTILLVRSTKSTSFIVDLSVILASLFIFMVENLVLIPFPIVLSATTPF